MVIIVEDPCSKDGFDCYKFWSDGKKNRKKKSNRFLVFVTLEFDQCCHFVYAYDIKAYIESCDNHADPAFFTTQNPYDESKPLTLITLWWIGKTPN